ncbi:tRNA 2-thiouridine(34) synthase MnmA [Carboxylicivirga mesophila]|uniref:tRNA-specific 2-thiouridylase MnmA n=1 Tax=Carboxylicivirga mesophila TaxID=1166478 RepID=A0ABS5KCP1_9BACT|nr:tRNA 2-thiouridine(34) synthase MnmA [Carboxylicivirga mesophila]MBS2212805.1 tRNA 2-thiouridine(34) synthase MnmA [Carboxylicivirga mesophila]
MAQERVLLGMSGGMDSSMSAVLLQQQGYEVIGATLLTHTNEQDASIIAAQNLAKERQIEHHLIDCREQFKSTVIQYFADEYTAGRTPNPCIKCNETIKWKLLLEQADQLNCKYIATGHYVQKALVNDRYYIQKGLDPAKDQSYFLWNLNQATIERALFPLGLLHKQEVRKLARQLGYTEIADKKESMGVCFLAGTDYRHYLTQLLGEAHPALNRGQVVDENGTLLGHHEGYPFYTIGQRRGIEGIANGKCVIAIDAENKQLIAGNRDNLFTNRIILNDFSLTNDQTLWKNQNIFIRIRGLDSVPGYWGSLELIDDSLIVQFENNVWAVTPGQSIVFYKNHKVIGGGIY